MHYRLVFRNGPRAGRVVDLPTDEPLLIGRLPECEIRLTDAALSKRHCRLEAVQGELRITDLKSSNGTFVNGARVEQRFLHEGDQVRIGDTFFLVEAASETEALDAPDAVAASATDPPATKHPTTAIPMTTSAHPTVRLCEVCGAVVLGATKSPAWCKKCRDPLVGGTLGNYSILERIALGTTSTVYRAEHTVMRRPCAVKVLLPECAARPEVLARFNALGRTGIDLDHPNQVQVLNVGVADGRPYLVMDYVSGVPVESLVGVSRHMDADGAMSISLQIAAALVDAEGKEKSHGDLSPRHILVSRGGRVRVVGFGCEWSPEAAQKDLFGLGSMTRCLLMGQPTAHPHAVKEALSADHQALAVPLERLLSSKEEERYPSAMDFLLDAVPIVIRRRGRSGLPETVREMPGLEKIVRRGSGTLHELRLAADLTNRLVPERLPEVQGYVLAKATKPASAINSDYYDTIELADGTLGIVLAGGPRTGVSGAMTMLMVRSAFQSVAAFGLSPAKLLEELHVILRGDLKEGLTIPAVYAVLDPKAHTLTTAQAGAPGPLLWNRGQTRAQPTRADGTPLSSAEFQPGDDRTIAIQPEDRLVLATPWVTGTTNLRGEVFGLSGLIGVLRRTEGDLRTQLEAVVAAVASHRGPSTPDHDLTVMGIERTP